MKKISFLLVASAVLALQAKAQLAVFTDDYAPGVSFVPFGGSVNELSVDNTVFHSGTASLKINVTTGYTGGAFVAAAPTNLSAYNAVSFWAKETKPFALDGVGLGNNAVTTVYAAERNGVQLTTGWVKYIIPIPIASKLSAETGLFHFAEGSGEGMNTIWIDDIQYENIAGGVIGTPTASFATETQSKEVGQTFNVNGTTTTFPVNGVNQQMQTAKAYFSFESSNPAVATFDAMGTGTTLMAGTTVVTGALGAVAAVGLLTVNVTTPTGPSTAAPTPNRMAADVKSLFSNAYTNIAVETWSTGWSSSFNALTEVQVAGNDTKKYQLNHFAGVEFIGAPVDATVYDYLHIDVWTPDANKPFNVRLVDFNAPTSEATLSKTTTQNAWTSLDIKVSDFTALAAKTKISQMVFLVEPGTTGTFFIDNVYFYKAGVVAPTEPVTAAPTPPARNTQDVISLFSEAYTPATNAIEWFPNWGQTTVVTDIAVEGNATKKYANLNYQGVNFIPAIDASGMKQLHLDLWTPDCTEFDVFLINPGPVEKRVTLKPTLSGWNSFDIDLNATNYPGINFGNIFQFKLEGRPSGSTVYLDNIYFYTGTALPVTIGNFTVAKNGNTAAISWNTLNEANNKGFAIERSNNAVNWVQISFINSIGTGNAANYTATDLVPAAGINYYRLKQVDKDGHFEYFPVRTLSFDASGLAKLALLPNPAKDKISISLGAITSKAAQYNLIDASGKTVKAGTFGKNQGNTVQTIQVSGLAKGLYIFTLTDGLTKQSAKLMLQ